MRWIFLAAASGLRMQNSSDQNRAAAYQYAHNDTQQAQAGFSLTPQNKPPRVSGNLLTMVFGSMAFLEQGEKVLPFLSRGAPESLGDMVKGEHDLKGHTHNVKKGHETHELYRRPLKTEAHANHSPNVLFYH